jgi:hypothetical protein
MCYVFHSFFYSGPIKVSIMLLSSPFYMLSTNSVLWLPLASKSPLTAFSILSPILSFSFPPQFPSQSWKSWRALGDWGGSFFPTSRLLGSTFCSPYVEAAGTNRSVSWSESLATWGSCAPRLVMISNFLSWEQSASVRWSCPWGLPCCQALRTLGRHSSFLMSHGSFRVCLMLVFKKGWFLMKQDWD